MTKDKENNRFSITTIIAVVAVLLNILQFIIAVDSKNEKEYMINQIDTLRLEMIYKDQQLNEYQNRVPKNDLP